MRKEFWDVNRRLLKISSSGRINFTEEGKVEYRSLFYRHGYMLEDVTTLQEFRRVMQNIIALQAEDSKDNLLRSIRNPLASEGDPASLASPAYGETHLLARPAAQIVNLAAWRARISKR
jgi:uncharacterized protein YjhX (UPF0386 family)